MLRRGLFRLLEGARGTDLVNLPFLTGARIRQAEMTLDVLNDPAIRVLFGPRSMAGRVWDRLADHWRSDAERAMARLGRLPSAIPAESFARAVVDALVRRVDLSAVRPEDGPSAANIEAAAQAVRQLVEDLATAADQYLQETDGLLEHLPVGAEMRARLRRVVGRMAVAQEVGARLDRLDAVKDDAMAAIEDWVRQADAEVESVLKDLGAWFDRSMERVSGWYARRAKLMLFLLGTLLAGAVNLDLTVFSSRILSDDALRQELVLSAQDGHRAGMPPGRPGREAEAASDPDAIVTIVRTERARLDALPGRGGAGFGRECRDGEAWIACAWRTARLSKVLSWILIGLGCMMGGQFWYDLLGAVLRFRPAARVQRPS